MDNKELEQKLDVVFSELELLVEGIERVIENTSNDVTITIPSIDSYYESVSREQYLEMALKSTVNKILCIREGV